MGRYDLGRKNKYNEEEREESGEGALSLKGNESEMGRMFIDGRRVPVPFVSPRPTIPPSP
jgi:hypothetical protein